MSRGYFISFEGLDGSGKTTQLQQLAVFLSSEGYQVTALRQPGSTALGDAIRAILLDSRAESTVGPIAPHAELALMFADRAQAIAQIIRPALEQGHIVLCDRFTDSSEAYQGAGRKLGSSSVLELHHAVCGDLWPDLTILLLPPLEVSLRRARRRNQRQLRSEGVDEGRFERESELFYARIYNAYQVIAQRDASRVVTIESGGSVDDINTLVRTAVIDRLPPRVETV